MRVPGVDIAPCACAVCCLLIDCLVGCLADIVAEGLSIPIRCSSYRSRNIKISEKIKCDDSTMHQCNKHNLRQNDIRGTWRYRSPRAARPPAATQRTVTSAGSTLNCDTCSAWPPDLNVTSCPTRPAAGTRSQSIVLLRLITNDDVDKEER